MFCLDLFLLGAEFSSIFEQVLIRYTTINAVFGLTDSTAEYINASDGTVSETGIHSRGLRCVTVLIGAYDLDTGRPLFGCVNQPFVHFDPQSNKYIALCYICSISRSGKWSAVAEMGDRLATIVRGRKLGGCAPFGGAGSPSNTMWPGPRLTFVPLGILIHPPVWPQ